MKNNFEERKERRIENAKQMAIKNQKLSEQLHAKAKQMSSVIPFGQPIPTPQSVLSPPLIFKRSSSPHRLPRYEGTLRPLQVFLGIILFYSSFFHPKYTSCNSI